MLSVAEADVILMTINFGNLKMIPFEMEPPQILNQRAFRLTFLFTKIYANVRKCLSVAGLKDFRVRFLFLIEIVFRAKVYFILQKVLDFDGVFFHWMHYKYIAEGNLEEIPSQLHNVKDYRLYDVACLNE